MSNETSFFKFIFNDDTKFAIINHAQISFIAFIPFYLLAMTLDALPEASIKKGVLELVFEIFLHVLILIIGIVIIVKFSVYFKPLSGVPYPEGFSFAPFILACLFIGITYQSKLS
jgi:general stress protein CsbA